MLKFSVTLRVALQWLIQHAASREAKCCFEHAWCLQDQACAHALAHARSHLDPPTPSRALSLARSLALSLLSQSLSLARSRARSLSPPSLSLSQTHTRFRPHAPARSLAATSAGNPPLTPAGEEYSRRLGEWVPQVGVPLCAFAVPLIWDLQRPDGRGEGAGRQGEEGDR
eukprot:6176800-Pleurochrysis_carterae.AAC.4